MPQDGSIDYLVTSQYLLIHIPSHSVSIANPICANFESEPDRSSGRFLFHGKPSAVTASAEPDMTDQGHPPIDSYQP